MNKQWPQVPLGELLLRSDETVEPVVDVEYREITVRLWGNGVVERGRVMGAQLPGRRFLARAGQFIASRIDARNGAMGIVPASLEGALVTNDFPLFNLNPKRLEPEFIGWLCRTSKFVELCQRASEGTTNRVRLKEYRFLALTIPLPLLAEQRRVVARIEELNAQIQEALKLRERAADETEMLVSSVGSALLRTASTRFESQPLIEACDFQGGSQPPKSMFRYEPAPGYVRFLQIRDFSSDGHLTFIPESTRNSMVKPHEVLIGRYGASLGKILRGKAGAYNVAMCKAVPKRDDLDLDFLAVSLRYGAFQERLKEISRSAQAGFNKADLKDVQIVIPPGREQRRIVVELDSLQAKVDALKRVQAETVAELDALMPSILSKAFNGEL